MKKLLLPIFVLLFFIACEKESTTEILLNQDDFANTSVSTRSNKRDVCHNGSIININVNAIAAHQAHGDAVDMDEDGFFDLECDCGDFVDCDDTNEDIYPGAEEICNNGIDDDCDGNIDGADSDCASNCVPEELGNELSVTINTGSETYTLYVYPVDNRTYIYWSNSLTDTGAKDIWDGDANTDAVVQDQGADINYAAGLCASLKADGCDWYLPAKSELNAMYEKFGQGGTSGNNEMASGRYWSSTEHPSNESIALGQDFQSGTQFETLKFLLEKASCRCVRR